MLDSPLLQQYGVYLAFCVGGVFVLAGMLLMFAERQMRRVNVPSDASLTETLQVVPLALVVAIDLLDFGFDFVATPFVWVILDQMGLKALRNASTLEAFIPFITQPIPTFTLAWIAVNWFGIHL